MDRRKTFAAAAAAAVALVLAGTALAVVTHPKVGHYAGFTNAAPIVGFKAPVRFSVPASKSRLLGFTYGALGCFGSGGFRPGVNPYKNTSLLKVGTVGMEADGHFAISNAVTTYHSGKYGFTYITTSQISGRFTTSKRASGTIKFSQKYIPKTGKSSTCQLTTPIKFTATKH